LPIKIGRLGFLFDYQYRFNGELLKTRIEKKNGSTVLSTKILSYEYDHLGRKVSYVHNGKPIVKYLYDGIGRLITKKFSPSGTAQGSKQTGNWTDASNWLSGILPTLADNVTINTGQTITIPSGESAFAGVLNDKGIVKNFGTLNMGKATSTDLYNQTYFYHIRGALKGINTDVSGNLTNNLFSYKLDYENGVNGLFDGNISKQSWKSNIDNKERSYTFSYDGASRLKSSTYASIPTGENYSLNNVDYDLNGNIKALSRSGATNSNYTSFGNVDNLTYTYQNYSNKLLKIADATTTNTDLGDFRDGTNTDNDYEYWADGSLKKDKNKKIASITYNYLKLPEIITFDDNKTITTEYDASGAKLKKIVSGGETTDYEEDDIYVNNVLYQTSHDEGRIANGIYEYNITAHNNDLRVAFKDSLGIAVPTQSIFYDPWGLTMKGMSITRNPTNFNKYQFLNRELQIETGLVDLMKRQFDPQTGRFVSVDPSPDVAGQESLSVYQYGWNNPILKPDPNGDCPICPAIPFLPQIGIGLVAAGEAITGLFVGSEVGTAIGTASYSDGSAMIPYNVQMYAHKVEREMSQLNTKQQTMDKNSKDGKAREAKTDKELKAENPDSKVQGERYLRDKDGKIVKDPVTDKGRRIDHAVIKDDKVTKLVETTSPTANKKPQADKEQRIRNEGGTYIRDKENKKKLYDVSDVPTERRNQN
jgi:RHS repeat-associated protein